MWTALSDRVKRNDRYTPLPNKFDTVSSRLILEAVNQDMVPGSM
jgi:hypothetical protein